MDKVVKVKPLFFSRRINSMAVIVILTTVLVLKFTELDKAIFISIASVLVFITLIVLFYLNSKEIQIIKLDDKAFTLIFFNRKSIFFRKKDVSVLKNEGVVNIIDDKLQIKNTEGFIGNVRLKALEDPKHISILEEYFNLSIKE
jgi:hypothetical protein